MQSHPKNRCNFHQLSLNFNGPKPKIFPGRQQLICFICRLSFIRHESDHHSFSVDLLSCLWNTIGL
jgi:hypothetical protein